MANDNRCNAAIKKRRKKNIMGDPKKCSRNIYGAHKNFCSNFPIVELRGKQQCSLKKNCAAKNT